MPELNNQCRSCGAPSGDQQRCDQCQVSFEAWLRDDSPVTYQSRRDGVWRDVARPARG